MNDLHEKIAKRRAALGLSLHDVGAKAGLSYQAVFKVERGLGRLETLGAVARALGISKREILAAVMADARAKLA